MALKNILCCLIIDLNGESMKLSIVVPVYNVETTLENCLESIVSQTYRDIEIIIIDDGSFDKSTGISDSYANNCENVIVIHQRNSGVSAARNKGLSCVTGDFITFVDSDDTIDIDMYEVLISSFEADTDVVHCSYKRIENGKTKNVGGSGEILIQNREEAIEYFLLGKRFTGSLWNKIVRKSIIEFIRFNETLVNNEDFLFFFQILNNAQTMKFIDICKYNYIVRQESATNTLNEVKKIKDSLYVCQYMYVHLKNQHLKQIAFNRLVSTESFLYQNFLKHKSCEKKVVRKRLKEYKKQSELLSKRNKTILVGLLYMPHLYCAVHDIYGMIRKPNWDVN